MEQNKKTISVVIPEYCGESMLAELLKRLHATLQTLTDSYEIILVNDCSPDNVWEAIRQVCAVDKRVVGLNLSRNFGEHYAISAGLRYARSLVEQGETRVSVLRDAVLRRWASRLPLGRLDYRYVVDPVSLATLDEVKGPALMACAVKVGKARLIDNILLK